MAACLTLLLWPPQVILVMLSFITSTLMFPILASIITTTLISMDSLREEYQRQLDSLDQYMAHRQLPLGLRSRIRAAMDYQWRTRRAIKEVRSEYCPAFLAVTCCEGAT